MPPSPPAACLTSLPWCTPPSPAGGTRCSRCCSSWQGGSGDVILRGATAYHSALSTRPSARRAHHQHPRCGWVELRWERGRTAGGGRLTASVHHPGRESLAADGLRRPLVSSCISHTPCPSRPFPRSFPPPQLHHPGPGQHAGGLPLHAPGPRAGGAGVRVGGAHVRRDRAAGGGVRAGAAQGSLPAVGWVRVRQGGARPPRVA